MLMLEVARLCSTGQKIALGLWQSRLLEWLLDGRVPARRAACTLEGAAAAFK
jgi:hypothetical protein